MRGSKPLNKKTTFNGEENRKKMILLLLLNKNLDIIKKTAINLFRN
jgi:hypothetical protein